MADRADDTYGTQARAVAGLLRGRVEQGQMWLEVSGRSMHPTIEEPAQLLLRSADRPRAGQVWAFVDDEGCVVAHRFVRRLPDGTLRFKGDASARHDRAVAPEQLVGKVERAVDRRGDRAVRRRRRSAWRAVVSYGVRRRCVAIVRRIVTRRHAM